VTKRVTVADIAGRTGLSKGAVSYALNGRPGVSELTRQRVLRVAAELGWQPDGPPKTPAGVFGLVLTDPADTLGEEPFFMKLISGMEAAMAPSGTGVLLQSVADHDAEIETYRRWWAGRRVDGVFLLDPGREDPRVAVLGELRLPAVVLGGPGHLETLPCVRFDDAATTTLVLDHLTALGHHRVARVAGVPGPRRADRRAEVFDDLAARAGLEWTVTVDVEGGGAEQAARATRDLLAGDRRPTAIVYDTDVLALAGVAAAGECGLDVPDGLSVLVWDDSTLCDVVHPALTAVRRDLVAYGRRAAEHLLAVLRGDEVGDVESPQPRLVVRSSTGRNSTNQEVHR
jgi:DNA-binding LacI/PurR family transcriptional regulator